MLGDLEDLLARPANADLEAADFERAADRLLSQQCLFRDDWNARRTYELIVRFKGYFADLFATLGRDLVVTERELMVELRPRESMSRLVLPLDETILLLALRAAFEQGVSEFAQGDYGEIEITSMALLERYDPLTGRARPPWPRVRDILRGFERRRFVDLGQEFPEESGVMVTVRPAIRGVTGEGWLARIEDFLKSRDKAGAKDASTDGTTAPAALDGLSAEGESADAPTVGGAELASIDGTGREQRPPAEPPGEESNDGDGADDVASQFGSSANKAALMANRERLP